MIEFWIEQVRFFVYFSLNLKCSSFLHLFPPIPKAFPMALVSTHTLSPVPETLLIPLLGRARETDKSPGILSDPKAQAIVAALDYDFSKFEAAPTLWATCVRTRLMDGYLEQLLRRYPQATVVEIGCGLNTRYERQATSSCTWFDLDVPEVHQLWRRFFAEVPVRRRFLATSAYDLTWLDCVAREGQGPFIFVAEASIIYFDADQNRRLFQALAQRFPGCFVIFDSVRASMIHQQGWHDALRHCRARLQWELDSLAELSSWQIGFRLIDQINFCLPPPLLRAYYPSDWLAQMRWLDWFRPDITRSYFINFAQLGIST